MVVGLRFAAFVPVVALLMSAQAGIALVSSVGKGIRRAAFLPRYFVGYAGALSRQREGGLTLFDGMIPFVGDAFITLDKTSTSVWWDCWRASGSYCARLGRIDLTISPDAWGWLRR